MPIVSCDGTLCITHFVVRPDELPRLLAAHRQHFPDTPEIERDGRALAAGAFQPQPTSAFVERVMRWGGGDRNVSRVLQQTEQLPTQLSAAYHAGMGGHITDALEQLTQINRLGIAFASKVLRFLLPEHAVILDSVIRENLGYRDSLAGYNAFLAECHGLLDHVRGPPHPLNAAGGWRICDIEAAIYAKLQDY